jgi:streptomycin 6-kinase
VIIASASERLLEHARRWRVTIDDSRETPSSLIAYGRRGSQPVVLKVVKHEGDEWRSGETLTAFCGKGVVRVCEHDAGALLLERLSPGHSLVDLVISGRDDEATSIVARIIDVMSAAAAPEACPTVHDWGTAFDRYTATGDSQISEQLVSRAREVYSMLASSQRNPRLLHGDLQHSNILFDRDRGWVAIDPKGVIGDVEFEIGAALRNPRDAPALMANSTILERRLRQYATALSVDYRRVVGWAFAQAVLSAIWSVEDDGRVEASDPSLLLADAIEPMLDRARL